MGLTLKNTLRMVPLKTIFRDKMEQEWEMYLMAAPICFIGVPVSYLFVGKVSSFITRVVLHEITIKSLN